MATTYSASKVAAGVQARNVNGLTTVFGTYALTGALVINDVIQMVKVPAGAVIQDVKLMVDALDSSTGVVTAVGDSTTADRFISGATIGRSGAAGLAQMTKGLNYKYEAETTINVKVTTAPTGTAATTGNINLAVTYTNQF